MDLSNNIIDIYNGKKHDSQKYSQNYCTDMKYFKKLSISLVIL